MQLINKFLAPALLILLVNISCNDDGAIEAGAKAEAPSFTVFVRPLQVSESMPFLQSFAWARQGDKVLLIGGRTQGFHGLSDVDSIFTAKKANTSIWVIDLSDFSSAELPLDNTNAQLLQFFSSNMAFYQDADTLFIAGGYGLSEPLARESNYTFDRIIALQVSEMIAIVEGNRDRDLQSAIVSTASSPILKVAGGELLRQQGIFYLVFGQNYSGEYREDLTGDYTSAVRQFVFAQGMISDTSSYIDTLLRRRDLTVSPIVQQAGSFYAAFGGVFTPLGDGYQNPVYISFNPFYVRADTLEQITSQYDCANASIYDPASDMNITILLGGIGKYQYKTLENKWEDGDRGALLPFVKTITQMKYQGGVMTQYIQVPPAAPELPALVGANAVFFPHSSLLYESRVMDYGKLQGDTVSIGYLYGGIKSTWPTSGPMYPTSVNNTVYEVFIAR